MTETASTIHHVTSTDGTRIGITSTGSGRPLVVVHGALNTAQDWQPLADRLTPHTTTWAVDRRGRGTSGDNTEHSLKQEQDDIGAVLDLVGPDAILVAHSFGASVALDAVLGRPLAGVVLYETGMPGEDHFPESTIVPFEDAALRGELDEAFEMGLRNVMRLDDAGVEAFRSSPVWSARAALMPTWGRELRALNHFGPDLGRFAAITAPTLVVVGELSPGWIVDNSRRLQRNLPNSRLIELPGQGHEAYLTGTEQFAEVLLDFVRDIDS